MRMRVAHENQKRSSIRWMGCKPKKVSEDDRKLWQNSKLKDEMDDVDILNYDENYDFDFESSSISKAPYILNFNKFYFIASFLIFNFYF